MKIDDMLSCKKKVDKAISSGGVFDLSDEELRDADPETYKKIMVEKGLKLFEPTEQDLQRKLNNKQLKMLCYHRPCRVLVFRWNPVEDYAERLRSEGRLQNRSNSYVKRILTKAVMKHKSVALYSQEYIDKQRSIEWRIRLKYNLMSIDYWEYIRNQQVENTIESQKELSNVAAIEIIESSEETSVQSALTEILNFRSRTNTPSESVQTEANSTSVLAVNDPNAVSAHAVSKPNSASDQAVSESIQKCSESIDVIHVDYLIEDSDSDVEYDVATYESIPTQMEEFNEGPNNNLSLNLEKLQQIATTDNSVIQNLNELNSESMTLGTESMRLTESEDVGLNPRRSEKLPFSNNINYDDFDTQVPLTSTQSQGNLLCEL